MKIFNYRLIILVFISIFIFTIACKDEKTRNDKPVFETAIKDSLPVSSNKDFLFEAAYNDSILEILNKEPLLECIIDNYVKLNEITKSDFLLIRDLQQTEDGQSFLIITTLPIKYKYYSDSVAFSTYNGIELEMYRGTYDEDPIIKSGNWISNNLSWKKPKKINSEELYEYGQPKMFDPDEIALSYYPEKNCVVRADPNREVINKYDKIIEMIMLNCKTCD